jgi:hypothetical protein
MGMLTGKELLTPQKLNQVKVDLGNDDFVYVREMTGHERDAFEQSLSKEFIDAQGKTEYKRDVSDFRAKLVVGSLCDENGKNLLELKDYLTLSKSIGIRRLEKIVKASQELNKISEEDKDNLVKNSKADPDDASSSGSADV